MKIHLVIEKGSDNPAVNDGCRDGAKLANITSVVAPSLSNSPINHASQAIEKSIAACSVSSSPGIAYLLFVL